MFSSKYVVSALDYVTKGLNRLQAFFAVFSFVLLTIGTFLSPIGTVFAINQKEEEVNTIINESKDDTLNYLDLSPDQIPIAEEDVSRRTANEKHFRKTDGTYELSVYPEDVHYFNEGKWNEIDNSLTQDKSGKGYINSANVFTVLFPNRTNKDEFFTIFKDEFEIKWRIQNSQSSTPKIQVAETRSKDDDPRKLTNKTSIIKYDSINNGVDISYQLIGTKVKETIVLNQYIDNFNVVFEYRTKGLSLIERDNQWVFVDSNKSIVFQFGRLFMVDAKGDSSFDVSIIADQISEDTYIVTLTASNNWLKEANYPVIVDPNIEFGDNNSLKDTYLSSALPYTSMYYHDGLAVNNQPYFQDITMIGFDIPSIINQKVITYSKLKLTPISSINNGQINMYLNDFQFNDTSTWENTQTEFEDYKVIDYHVLASNRPVVFDFTEALVQRVSEDKTHISLSLVSDSDYATSAAFFSVNSYSQNWPTIHIGYEDPSGIKDYWTYSDQNIGNAGTGLVSDFTGHLTWTRNEYQLTNELMQLNLSFHHSYVNRNTNIGYGYGWKTNFNYSLIVESNKKTLKTPFGEELQFKPMDYIDPSNPTQILTGHFLENGSGWQYLSEQGNHIIKQGDIRYYFVNQKLVKVKNEITTQELLIFYQSGSDRIDRIQDSVGNFIEFIYNSNLLTRTNLYLVDNNSNHLVEYRTYEYNAKKLNTIYLYYNYNQSSTGTLRTLVEYQYDLNQRLIEVTDFESKEHVVYTYQQFKVKTITRFIENDKIGKIDIDYKWNKTTFTNHLGEKSTYLFDHYGHTINIIDNYGYSSQYKYSGLFSGSINDTEYFDFADIEPNYLTVHKLIESSSGMSQLRNPITNHGFEEGLDGWSQIIGAGGSITQTSTAALGSKAIKITQSSSSTYSYQSVYLAPGNYTISGWIKHDGNGNAYIESSSGTVSESARVSNSTEWIQYSRQLNLSSHTNITIRLKTSNLSTAEFDNIQISNGFIDTRYNLLNNQSFESNTTGWTNASIGTRILNNETDVMGDILGRYSMKIDGNAHTEKKFYQSVSGSFGLSNSIMVGAWGKSDTQPNKAYSVGTTITDDRFFGLVIEVGFYPNEFPEVTNY